MTYTVNPAVVRTTINGISYQIPYTQTVPNALPNLTGYPSGVAGVVQAWWDGEDQVTWTQEPDPEPPAPEPNWAGFNLAMVPPSSQSSFEVWLSQFKPAYQTALTVPAALGQLSETQSAYNTLKTLAAPTAEQVAEWQGIADQFHIGITF